jgi:hypothetical protein
MQLSHKLRCRWLGDQDRIKILADCPPGPAGCRKTWAFDTKPKRENFQALNGNSVVI